MLDCLRRFLAPPIFPDEERTRKAELLNIVVLAALAILALYLLVQAVTADGVGLLIGGVFTAALIGLWWGLRQGAVQWVSLLFCSLAFVGLVIFGYELAGVTRSISSFSMLILAVVSAGIFLGGRAALVTALLSAAAGWWLMQSEATSLFPHLIFFTTLDAWLGQALVLCLSALLLALADRSLRRALTTARHSQAALQQRTLELEQERSALRTSEERYRNFIEQSVEGIWLVEFEQPVPIDLPPLEQVHLIHHSGYVVECNEALARMYGYDNRRELIGKHLIDLYGGSASADNVAATLKLVQAGYRSGNRETVEVSRQGETLYFLNNAVGTVSDGRLTAIWGMQRDVTDRKLIEQMLDRRARHLQTAADISRAMASILDLTELLPRIVELLKDGFKLYYAGLFLIDDTNRQAVLRAATGEAGQQMLRQAHQLALNDQSMIGWCIVHQQARLALDVGDERVRFDNPLLPATRSEIALPLINWGRTIGALTIQSDRPRAFTQDDAAVLQTMADQVAIAINNALLFEGEKRNTALMTALRDIRLDFSAQLELSALLEIIVKRAAQLLDSPMGELLLVQADGETLREAARFNASPNPTIIYLGEGVSGRVAQTGEPLIVDDYALWSGRLTGPAGTNYRSVLSVPVQWQGRVTGVLNVLHDRPGRFNPDDATVLELFAAQAAVALDKAHLFEAVWRRANELNVLHEVALATTEAADVEQLIDRSMKVIGQILFPEYAGILLADPTTHLLQGRLYQAGVAVSLENNLVQGGQGIVGSVAATGEPRLIADVRTEPDYRVLYPNVLSELCVPMKVGDRVIGVLNVESHQLAAFSGSDEQLLSTVAGHLATAIERLRAEAARRQQEEELAQERNLLRTLIDNLPDAHVFVKDVASRFITTNAAHLQTIGAAALDEVIGKTDFDFFPRENAERYYADEQHVLQANRPMLNREEQVIDRAGHLRWYLTHKVPLRDRQGAVVGLVGMSLDITVRKQMEERERAIARSLQAVVEAADELLQIDELDRFYQRAVELAREKLNVERCGIFLLAADRHWLTGMFGTDLQGRTTDERFVRIPVTNLPVFSTHGPRRRMLERAKQGYWGQDAFYEAGMGWVALTLIGSSDEVIGVFSNDSAISQAPVDEVQQEALAIYCSLLGNIIIRKRSAQEREKLINELEAKNAELERFTYTVSHDLKSPLITIRGFMGFLEHDAAAGNLDRLRSDLARITQATDKMQRLLNELLELSRIGRLVNAPERVAFGTLAREAVALVEGRLSARGVRVEIAPDLPDVYVDRARLVEVLQNLVDNAAKFMSDQPEPLIEIGMRTENKQRIFLVRDNGLGIDPTYHDKVFGLFDKLDPKSEGTGIGLALVKRIIEVHGGRVWVESAGVGHGATFCFTLPA
jgi:PAS domain S-box-containing protein